MIKESDLEGKRVLPKKGDGLFFYTDGLVDAADAAGVEFGINPDSEVGIRKDVLFLLNQQVAC